jgi:AAA+ ATPase superfamily predicted ATPase
MEFRNRDPQLQSLNEHYKRRGATFMVVYGRRRIGKTVLLRHWIEKHLSGQHLLWTAHRSTSEVLLAAFSEAVAKVTPGVHTSIRFPNWSALFEQLFSIASSRRLVVVIDEFPYLVECAPEIPSLLQKLWDKHKENSHIFLILCGSHFHMMHEQFVSRQKPLYGRVTESLVLDEIAPEDLGLFLPRYSPEQIVETYSVIGGIPGYLELWDDRTPVFRNIEQRILSGTTFFSQEATVLIQDEIAEPRTYLAILEAMGAKRCVPSELARATGIAINHMGKYLRTLLDLRFIRRILSEDVKQRTQTRMSRYEIRDPFLRFHFQFIYPHADLVEQKRRSRLSELVHANFDSYVGHTAYEELARRRIARLGDEQKLPFVPDYVGRAWTRHAELDVVAVGWKQKSVLIGECKWQSGRMTDAILEGLIARAGKLPNFASFKKSYALFSKTGFSASLEKRSSAENILLFNGAKLEMLTPS